MKQTRTIFVGILAICATVCAIAQSPDKFQLSSQNQQLLYSLSISGGGEVNGVSFSGGLQRQMNATFALGLGAGVSIPESKPDGVLDYPIPHTSYRVYDTYRGTGYWVYGIFGANVAKDIRVKILYGLASLRTDVVLQSTATGWLYNDHYTRSTETLQGVGIDVKNYFVEYDNIRGVSVGVTWRR